MRDSTQSTVVNSNIDGDATRYACIVHVPLVHCTSHLYLPQERPIIALRTAERHGSTTRLHPDTTLRPLRPKMGAYPPSRYTLYSIWLGGNLQQCRTMYPPFLHSSVFNIPYHRHAMPPMGSLLSQNNSSKRHLVSNLHTAAKISNKCSKNLAWEGSQGSSCIRHRL